LISGKGITYFGVERVAQLAVKRNEEERCAENNKKAAGPDIGNHS
jgi:hypothetical protein